MVNKNAQDYINEKYPKNGVCKRENDAENNKGKKREEITVLDISKGKVGKGFLNNDGKTLTGSLKLEGFTKLRILIIDSHQLTELDVSECPKLKELYCQNNQLDSLNVTGCVNLERIDCSSNSIESLDLSTCAKLEEVNINNCPELSRIDKIKSNLTHDKLSGKLVKSSGYQIIQAKENDIRNILIVGMIGSGKSTLTNVLADIDWFQEGYGSVGLTKSYQSTEFKWEKDGEKIKYRVIDTIGFWDTDRISENDILFEIGKAIHSVKEGINQVLFVFGGRFSPKDIEFFSMLKDFIFETGITKFTTLIRTNFADFRSKEKCQEDKNNLLAKNQELKEIINSCNGIIYVNNLPHFLYKEDSEEEEKNKEQKIRINKRKESRKRVLDHLVKSCPDIYKLKEWDNIYSLADNYIKKEEEINAGIIMEKDNGLTKGKELEQAKNEMVKETKNLLETEYQNLINIPQK